MHHLFIFENRKTDLDLQRHINMFFFSILKSAETKKFQFSLKLRACEKFEPICLFTTSSILRYFELSFVNTFCNVYHDLVRRSFIFLLLFLLLVIEN